MSPALPPLSAAALGALQGLTELLPVSSDGHLALAELLFGVGGGGVGFNALLHIGTLLATGIVIRRRLAAAAAAGFSGLLRPARLHETPGGRDVLSVIVASVPSAVIGIGLRDPALRFASEPLIIGLGFLGTAVLLVCSGLARRGDAEQPSYWGALAIGVAQGFSVLPGLSRSGSTIAAALWLGLRPERAFELSMLMSLPAALGLLLLEAPHVAGHATLGSVALVGPLAALLTGLAALVLLERIVARGKFMWFALWVGPLAIATIAMGMVWPG